MIYNAQHTNMLACALLVAVVLLPAASATQSAYRDTEGSVGNVFSAGVWEDAESLAQQVETSAFLFSLESPPEEGGEVAGVETEEPKVDEKVVEPLPEVEVSDEPLELVEPAEEPAAEPEPTPELEPELETEEKEEVPEPTDETEKETQEVSGAQ